MTGNAEDFGNDSFVSDNVLVPRENETEVGVGNLTDGDTADTTNGTGNLN